MIDPPLADQPGDFSTAGTRSTVSSSCWSGSGSATRRAFRITIVVIREVSERRVGPERSQELGRVARVARLLAKLPRARHARVLARIDEPAGDLQAVASRTGPELPDQQHLVVRGQGHDMDRVGQVDHVEVVDLARWRDWNRSFLSRKSQFSSRV